MNKSIEKSEERLDIRLEGMNEWRAQMKDQTGTFITRAEVDLKTGSLSDRIDDTNSTVKDLELDRAELRGKANQKSVTFTLIMAVIGTLISIISFFIMLGKL